jgi:hypothetical protein
MRRDLNDAFLRAVKTPVTGRLELRDTRVVGLVLRMVGLVLRMTPSGTATWSLRTRTRDGRQTRPTLGSWPAMGIAEARRAALATLCSVQAGADPVAAKRAARATRDAARARHRGGKACGLAGSTPGGQVPPPVTSICRGGPPDL